MRKSKSTMQIAKGTCTISINVALTIHFYSVDISINTPFALKVPTVQPDIPTIQTSLTETPDEISYSNPFLNGGIMSNNVHIKQTMTKAKSMARACVCVCVFVL